VLNSHSYYSLRYGILTVENVIEFAVQNESEVVALTEINSTTTLHDFLRLSKKNNIRPLWGIDFRNDAKQLFVAYAQNTAGVNELGTFLSEHLHQKKDFETRAPQWKHCVTIYPFENFKKNSFDLNEEEYLGVTSADLPIFERSEWKSQREKVLAFQTSTFQSQRHFNMHQLLRCIENNILLSRLQPTDQGKRKDVFLSEKELQSEFEGAPDLLDKSKAFAQQWSWNEEVNHAVSKNQNTFTGSLEEDMSLLRQLTQEGLAYRYGNEPNNHSVIEERIQKELEIIEQKNFVSYFLINWDITQFARDRGYYYVGRGSGANSVIAYLLRITDVDPIELDLYFERFINLYRQNPPDFDIDFSWTDREEITEYIFERYQNVALLGAYNTFQYKAVVRELGKVFGLPVEEIELLSSGKFNPNTLDKNQQNVMRYASFLQDFPNSLSIHSCGILISNEPIHNYTATFLPPKGHPTVMFDMVVAEDIGLHKFDILSQRGLAKIKEAVQLVKERYPLREIDLHQVAPLKQDERIKDLLRNAKAIGCFYVESPAMRMLLTKLQVDDYLGLVAASSVIRPGVSSSGMMKEFIHRHRDPKARERAHPQLLAIMPETYGVMVYQEDVIKVGHYFGGLTLAEADVLRRGMSGKFRGREEFERTKESFFEKAISKGNAFSDVAEIWRQVESFAGYAFAKGHSASYAVESYQSLFLKAYYPIEYMTATLNHFGGFYDTEIYVLEAMNHGAKISAPCIWESDATCVLHGKEIILGFGLVKSLEANTIARILKLRQSEGIRSIAQLMDQAHVSVEQMSLLIRIGACRKFNKPKKDLLWETHFHGNPDKSEMGPSLFEEPEKNLTLPKFQDDWLESAFDEMELIGFPLCSPFDLASEELTITEVAAQLPFHLNKKISAVGYLVNVKKTRTSKGELMGFGTFLDKDLQFFDTVHFPNSSSFGNFRGRGIYKITGTVLEEFGAYSIECTELEKIPYKKDPRYI